MRKQDHLVALIRSLGANEKRYFKLFSALQPGEKRYLRLFDALESKQKYEGADLSRELHIEAWQLADDKYYLTQTLLQSLRNYDQEANELTVLRNNKENAQSLIMRRMFSFAADILEKTLERAWQLEAFEMIDGLLMLRSTCLQNLGQHDESMLVEHEKAAGCLTQIIELMYLRGKARHLEINAAGEKQFAAITRHPLIKGGTKKLNSLRAKSLRYETLAHYYSSTLNEDALVKTAKEERQLYLAHPQIKIINPIVYLTNISRLATAGTNYEDRQKLVESLLREVEDAAIKVSSQRRDAISWMAALMSLWNLRHLHRFKQALPVAEKTYALGMARTDYERFSIAFEYALVLLHNGYAAQAADKIDELLRFKTDVRLDMQPFVRVLQIMAHLNLQHYEIIPPAIKATRFWLKKRGAENGELALFLKQAGLIARAPASKSEAWKALQRDVQAGKMETIRRLLQLDEWIKASLKGGRNS